MFKRALVAASVVAAFAVPAAAEVVVYGSLRTGVEYGDDSVLSKVRLVDQNSRLGFKGSDKLDNGMKLLWKAESAVRVGEDYNGSNASVFNSRDTYVGIEDAKLGTFTLGRQVDAYGDWTVISPVLDGAMIMSEDSFIYQWDLGSRRNNLAKYVSPTFSGFQVEASYDFGKKVVGANNYAGSTLLTWSNDKFNAGVAYITVNDALISGTPTSGADQQGVAVGAGAKFGDLTVSGHFERVEKKAYAAVAKYERDDYGVGATYTAGKYTLVTQYLRAAESKSNGAGQDDGADQFNFGVRYALSKQTTAFANYTYLKNDKIGAYTTATGYGSADNAANVVAFSLRTDF